MHISTVSVMSVPYDMDNYKLIKLQLKKKEEETCPNFTKT